MRQIADASRMLIWMLDADNICTYLNPAAAAMFSADDRVDLSAWLEFVHPDDLPRLLPLLRAAIDAREEYQVRYRIIRSDGSIRWMMGSGAPRYTDAGVFAGYVGNEIDVSEQQHALQQAASSEAMHRLLTENSSDVISRHAFDGTILHISASVTRMLGHEPGELIGQNYLDALHPDDAGAVRAELNRQLKGSADSRVVELRKRHKDGHFVWFACKMRVLVDPVTKEGTDVISVCRDVTFERQAREELKEREERFRGLTDLSSDWYWETDAEGRFSFVSESVARVSNIPPASYLGKMRAEIVGRAGDPGLDEYARKCAAREAFRNIRFATGAPAGAASRFVSISGEPMFRDGAFTGYRGIGRDITEEVEVAERLAQLADESVRAQEELQRSKDQLATILESMGEAFFALDGNWRVTYANRKTLEFVGVDVHDALGRLVWEVVPAIRETELFDRYQAVMSSRVPLAVEAYWEPTDAWVEVRIYPQGDGIAVYFHNISDRRAAERSIRESEQRFREIIEMTPAGYILADGSARFLDVNPALCRLAGFSKEELVGQGMEKIFSYCPWHGALSIAHGPTTTSGMEAVVRHKNGQEIHILFSGTIKRDGEGAAQSFTAFLTDITERKQAENQLEKLATHDTLTGLPNRVFVNRRLQAMLDAAGRNDAIAVMFIDLDRFKEVNDSMGHAPGDLLLCDVAGRLQKCMRPGDLVARLGGDEFVVAAHCSEGRDSAAAIANKLLAALAEPFIIEGQEVVVGASIGISMFAEDARSKDLLFQNADTAMYHAKDAGRSTYRFFEAEMSAATKRRVTIEQSLRHALERGEFTLHYQPRVDLKTLAFVGLEALLRWNSPQLGAIPPSEFIPIAEERGFIAAIGRWVLGEATRQTSQLARSIGREIRVSVNLSAQQLKCDDLIEQVSEALGESGFPPRLLELELTETALIDNVEHSVHMLRRLKGLGLLLSVDDFGTGYSALSYLKRFPVDILKLDRSFVHQQPEGISSFEFIKAFVDMAHALKLSVVGEGIETAEMLKLLSDAQCDEGQGYLFAKPMAFAELEDYLSTI